MFSGMNLYCLSHAKSIASGTARCCDGARVRDFGHMSARLSGTLGHLHMRTDESTYTIDPWSSWAMTTTRVCTSLRIWVSESKPRHASVPCHWERDAVGADPNGLLSAGAAVVVGCGVCCGSRFFCSTSFCICAAMSGVICTVDFAGTFCEVDGGA